jgi:Divergent InlB B-repeat domain
VVVSTDEDFSFNVTSNRDLVANYALGDRIDLAADPKTAGDISGAGVFPSGTEVTVTAEARPGYIFIDWTEAGDPVSTDANYTFTSDGPRNLIARFAALPKLVATPAVTPGQLVFTWPDTPNWVLKESPDLTTWTTSTRTITTTGGQKSVTVNASEGRVFFRLLYQ